MKMQIINDKYRQELRDSYEISSDAFSDPLLNNVLYAIVTDGLNWNFLQYSHIGAVVTCRVIHFEKIQLTDFFKTFQQIYRVTVDLCLDIVYNKFMPSSMTQDLNN